MRRSQRLIAATVAVALCSVLAGCGGGGMAPPDLRIAIANCLNKMAETGHNLNCFPIGQGVVPTLAIPNPAPGG